MQVLTLILIELKHVISTSFNILLFSSRQFCCFVKSLAQECNFDLFSDFLDISRAAVSESFGDSLWLYLHFIHGMMHISSCGTRIHNQLSEWIGKRKFQSKVFNVVHLYSLKCQMFTCYIVQTRVTLWKCRANEIQLHFSRRILFVMDNCLYFPPLVHDFLRFCCVVLKLFFHFLYFCGDYKI